MYILFLLVILLGHLSQPRASQAYLSYKFTSLTRFVKPSAPSKSLSRLVGRSFSASMIVSKDFHPKCSRRGKKSVKPVNPAESYFTSAGLFQEWPNLASASAVRRARRLWMLQRGKGGRVRPAGSKMEGLAKVTREGSIAR